MIKRPTLKDIAGRAGVSVSTVSYALNDASTVALSPDTRARVRRIAKDLGYIPNSLAQSLRARTSRSIGMIVTKPLSNPRYAAIVQGASAALATERMHLTILTDAAAPHDLDDYRSGRLDGVVFVGHDDEAAPSVVLDAARNEGLPLVVLDCGAPPADAPYSTVDFDYAGGATALLDELAERGVRSVLHVRPEVASRAERLREKALVGALARHPGLSLRVVTTGVTDDVLRAIEQDPELTRDYARDLGSAIDTALTAVNGEAAETAVLCSWGADVEPAMASRRVREDGILVAALAAGTLSPRVWPQLRYSRLPLARAGAEAARLIMQEIAGGGHEHLLLAPELDRP
ncbi:LacI family DNA-binding transcriptional regulator [Microbacterium resistens]|uniref:LacI family DNA-binding transcriptional regulator n=1 Tax=Microbacterium resistens TaxID=156977 RepID=UPI0022F037B9|nr:LacI family DNA-binding transcriptional regulator [Streptomyces sp. MS2A]